ncbi:MAG: glycosyltransferase family 4 protein [Alphaproteobacteria bacterium]|mgnify:CR=1 FL=1
MPFNNSKVSTERVEPHLSSEAKRGHPVVLQVLPSLETGGAERGAVDVACALVAAGGTAIVVSSGGRMVRELERGGAKHITLPVDSKSPLVMRANVRRLRKIILEHGVDIVHARSRAPAWSAARAAKQTGRRFVTTVHGPYSGGWLKRRYNAVMGKGDRVIAISNFVADYVKWTFNLGPPRVKIIHRGVDLHLFDPARVDAPRIINLARDWRLPDDVPIILLPGRLTRWKGQRVFIDAVAMLGRTDLCCVIVGSDQGRTHYRQELEEHIARRGVEAVVRIVPDCRDMPAAYMLSDVVVSASTDPEAFGRVIAEAQAMGRPVIATNHGAAPEIVVAGSTGWLVEPGSARALAEALQDAISLTREQRDEIAHAAMARVREHFTKDRMCAETIALYRDLLAEEGRTEAATDA